MPSDDELAFDSNKSQSDDVSNRGLGREGASAPEPGHMALRTEVSFDFVERIPTEEAIRAVEEARTLAVKLENARCEIRGIHLTLRGVTKGQANQIGMFQSGTIECVHFGRPPAEFLDALTAIASEAPLSMSHIRLDSVRIAGYGLGRLDELVVA